MTGRYAWWDGRLDPELGYGLLCLIAGVVIDRHAQGCRAGLWRVRVIGWSMGNAHAVVDDFGTLVQVY